MSRIIRESERHSGCFWDSVHSKAAYRKLEAWRTSMNFVEVCYAATRSFPRQELYGLTSQIRRAAVSIPSNVAEGYCRRRLKVYLNHVGIALGSHAELETCVELAFRLGFMDQHIRDNLDRELASVGRLLFALYMSLEETLRRRESGTNPRVIP